MRRLMRRGLAAWAAIMLAAVAVTASGQSTRLLTRVELDRPSPVYAVNDTLSLTLESSRDVQVDIWEIDAAGQLNRLTEQPLRLSAGQPARFPPAGRVLRVKAPLGRYDLRIVAQPPAPRLATRSLGDADARLAGADVRDERALHFTVVDPAAR